MQNSGATSNSTLSGIQSVTVSGRHLIEAPVTESVPVSAVSSVGKDMPHPERMLELQEEQSTRTATFKMLEKSQIRILS